MTWRTLILLHNILLVNILSEYESFDDWSWLRTEGGGGNAASLR